MSGYTTGLRNAYRRGKEAAAAGAGSMDNPYSRWDYRKSWTDGWRKAGGKDLTPKPLDGDPRDFPPPY